MINTNSTDTPITNTKQRQKAINFARTSVGLEGFKLSEATEEHAAKFIAGEVDLAEFLEPTR